MTWARRGIAGALCAGLLLSCHRPPAPVDLIPDEAGEFLRLLPRTFRLPPQIHAPFDRLTLSLFYRIDETGIYWGRRERMVPNAWVQLFAFGPNFTIPANQHANNRAPQLESVLDFAQGWLAHSGGFDGRIGIFIDERVPARILALVLNSLSPVRATAFVVVGNAERHGVVILATQRVYFPSSLRDHRRARMLLHNGHAAIDLGGPCVADSRRCVSVPMPTDRASCEVLAHTTIPSDATEDEFGFSMGGLEPVGPMLRAVQACNASATSPLRPRSMVLFLEPPRTCQNERISCETHAEAALVADLHRHEADERETEALLMQATRALQNAASDAGALRIELDPHARDR